MRRRKLNKSPVLGLCGFVIGYECKEKEIRLLECDKAQADAIIVPHHFSHKVTKNIYSSLVTYGRIGIRYKVFDFLMRCPYILVQERKTNRFAILWHIIRQPHSVKFPHLMVIQHFALFSLDMRSDSIPYLHSTPNLASQFIIT